MSNIEQRRELRALQASRTKEAVQLLLASSFGKSVTLNSKSRCVKPEHNLVGSYGSDLWMAIKNQLERGKGGELRHDTRGGAPKFCSAWSSAALAVDSVAPFLTAGEGALNVSAIPGIGGPGSIEFEARRSAGSSGHNWPNLDFIIDGNRSSVFLESKCTEYLATSHGALSPDYAVRAKQILSQQAAREVESIVNCRHRYRLLDAPQLITHFLAAKTFALKNPERKVMLVYAYWEPANPDSRPAFAFHRNQAATLFGQLNGEGIGLVQVSWPNLWATWAKMSPALADHVEKLVARYSVTLP
jgi:hypothetical protein